MNGIIESVTLQSGEQGSATPLKFDVASVNVFVGPNHSGKSLLLREIRPIIDWPYDIPSPKVLKSLQLAAWDDEAKQALADTIRAHAKPVVSTQTEKLSIMLGARGTSCSKEQFELIIQNLLKRRDMSGVHPLGDAIRAELTLNLSGKERLTALERSPRSAITSSASNVTSKLYQNDSKRVEARQIIHSGTGGSVYLFVAFCWMARL